MRRSEQKHHRQVLRARFDSDCIVDGFGFSHGGELAAWFGRWKLYVGAESGRQSLLGPVLPKIETFIYVAPIDSAHNS